MLYLEGSNGAPHRYYSLRTSNFAYRRSAPYGWRARSAMKSRNPLAIRSLSTIAASSPVNVASTRAQSNNLELAKRKRTNQNTIIP
jgi:hypothetical protein